MEDHSSDASAEIVKEYAQRDKRITAIFHSENLSSSQSRKDGVAASLYSRMDVIKADCKKKSDEIKYIKKKCEQINQKYEQTEQKAETTA